MKKNYGEYKKEKITMKKRFVRQIPRNPNYEKSLMTSYIAKKNEAEQLKDMALRTIVNIINDFNESVEEISKPNNKPFEILRTNLHQKIKAVERFNEEIIDNLDVDLYMELLGYLANSMYIVDAKDSNAIVKIISEASDKNLTIEEFLFIDFEEV